MPYLQIPAIFCARMKIIFYQLDGVSLFLKHTYGQETAEGQEVQGMAMYACAGDRLFEFSSDIRVTDDGSIKYENIKLSHMTCRPRNLQKSRRPSIIFSRMKFSEFFCAVRCRWKIPVFYQPIRYLPLYDRRDRSGEDFQRLYGQMNSNTFFANKATVLTDGTIFILYHINEQERLFCYSFDPEASLRPEHTITVYSLYDNLNIRKLITEFRVSTLM